MGCPQRKQSPSPMCSRRIPLLGFGSNRVRRTSCVARSVRGGCTHYLGADQGELAPREHAVLAVPQACLSLVASRRRGRRVSTRRRRICSVLRRMGPRRRALLSPQESRLRLVRLPGRRPALGPRRNAFDPHPLRGSDRECAVGAGRIDQRGPEEKSAAAGAARRDRRGVLGRPSRLV